jgi:DivIVA domain-containing protein
MVVKTTLTPAEIRHKEFSTTMGGYKKNEVRAFLELIATQVEDYHYVQSKEDTLAPSFTAPASEPAENALPTSAITAEPAVPPISQTTFDEIKKKEEMISRTLIQAETTRNDIVKLAQKEADNILREAELTAKRAIDETKNYLNLMKLEFVNLKENHRQYLMSSHSQLKVQLDRLENDPLFKKESEAQLNQSFENAAKLEPKKEEPIKIKEPEPELAPIDLETQSDDFQF